MPDYLRSPTCWSLFFASLFATAALTPLVMRFARRVGAMDSGGHRSIYVGEMPLLGGLGIVFPFIAVCLVGRFSVIGLFAEIQSMRPQFLVLGLGSLAIIALGIFDDIHGLRARYKLLAQVLIALVVVSAGDALEMVRLPFLGTVQLSTEIGILVGVAWVVGLINAINLIDGVDGLAAGISLIAILGLLALAAIGQFTFVVLLSVTLAGSLVGFLPYNYHPAKIFLGDTGSMFLGFALAMITLMGTYKSETVVIVLAPLLALGFPIFETVLSMTRRLVRGASIFEADDRHTHHRLLNRGFSQRKVVLLLYSVSGILTSMAIMSRLIPEGSRWQWLSPAIGLITLVGIGWLAGYLRNVSVEEVLQRRQRTAVLQAYAQYASLSLSAHPTVEKMKAVLELGRQELGLAFLAVSWKGGEAGAPADGCRAGDGLQERLRVKSAQSVDVSIEYAFQETPNEEDRRDVATCLARLFEQSDV